MQSLQRTAGNRAFSSMAKGLWDKGQKFMADQAKNREIEPYARAKAKEMINKAEEVEPRVTGHIRSVAFGRRGKPTGLEYRIKSESSLARKLRDRAAANELSTLAPAKAVEQEASTISDVLRYTIILNPDQTYNNLYQDISDKMQRYRYTPELRKNYWEKSTTYKGVNLTFKTPGTPPLGFEVQLHTDASFATKQLNHHEYEEERAAGTPEQRRAELNKIMEDRWEAVQVPEGFSSKRPAQP